MTTAKKNAAFFSHPWELPLSAFSDLPLAFCVFDATAAVSSLQQSSAAKKLATVPRGQGLFDLAEHVSAVCSGLAIADATPGLQTLLGASSTSDIGLKFASLMAEAPLPQLETLTQALLISAMPPTSFFLTSTRSEIGVTVQLLERQTYEGRVLILAKFELAKQMIDQRQRLEQFESLFDAMSEVVIIVGLNGDISYRNRSAKTMLGNPAKPANLYVKDLFHAHDEAAITLGCQAIMSGLQTWRGILTSNGEQPIELHCQMNAISKNTRGGVSGFSIVGRPAIQEETLSVDVEIRDKLIENSGKLVIMGQFFAQMIHEINNPLTVILGKAEKIVSLAEKKTLELSEYQLAAEKIIKMSRRVECLIRSMRFFSARGHTHPIDKVSMRQIVEDVRPLLESGARKIDVTLRIAEIPDELTVYADSAKLSQILLNLFNNSYDAIRGDRDSWVELRVTSDAGSITLHVVDSGRRIDQATRPKLFDAFFSTKGVHGGIGIGLTLSRQIARRFGGDLYLDETAPHTTFALVLPRLAADLSMPKKEI